ncbi:type II toxin-antitoxin system MqsA family antitoxin [Ningiella sp. W23]|uniref:type II toxin-antitoxin system MqsA family antitoxin n=1 Tax=Ningiella sp. W23 TaxID=3023715 RepID=UPI003757EDC5
MRKQSMLCDLCGEGILEEKQGTNKVEYKSATKDLIVDFCECNECGVETALPVQTRNNKRRMIAFKKEVDGLLTGAEVKKYREALKLKQSEAAKVFGGGVVAFSKYENDDVMQSDAMDKLIRVAFASPEAYKLLLANASINISTNVVYPVEWRAVPKEDSGKTFSIDSIVNDSMNIPTINPSQADWRDCQ